MTLTARFLLLVVFSLLPLTAIAQGNADTTVDAEPITLTPTVQYRLRGVTHSGKDLVSGDPLEVEYLSHRARLGMTANAKNVASLTLSLQDVRVWGEELNTLNDASANGLDLHEAFVSVPLPQHLTLRFGRQEINLDGQRLVGAVGWTQRARSFDAAHLVWAGDKVHATGFFSILSEKDVGDPDGAVPAGRSGDVTFGGLHAKVKLGEQYVSLAALSLGNVPSKVTRNTFGATAGGSIVGVTWTAEGFYQLGRIGGGTLAAWMAAVNLGYSLKDVPTSPTFTVWGEALSGDGTAQGAFDTLFATNHKFYGEMDFFLAIPKHTGNLGLRDLGGRIALKPAKGFGAAVSVHRFDTLTASAGGESGLGTELDVKLTYAATRKVKLDLVYGIMLPGGALAELKGVAVGSQVAEHLVYSTASVAY